MTQEIEVKRFYYPSGKLRSEISFKNGVPHGRHLEWHENGVLAFEENLKNEVPDGVARQWNKNGELLCTYEIKDGTGVQRRWFEDQGFWGEISWVNGAMTGRQRTYWADGTVASETFWINNEEVPKGRYEQECNKNSELPIYDE
jgi:antitoxin component YwqK of YwqJK toxin-antitoxin module